MEEVGELVRVGEGGLILEEEETGCDEVVVVSVSENENGRVIDYMTGGCQVDYIVCQEYGCGCDCDCMIGDGCVLGCDSVTDSVND